MWKEHWNKMCNNHNKTSKTGTHSDKMKVHLLSKAVNGIPELRAIKTTAKMVNGQISSLNHDQCFNSLIDAAQEFDKDSTKSLTRHRRRKVHNMDFTTAADEELLDFDWDDEQEPHEAHSTDVHNIDTPSCELHKRENPPNRSSRVNMPCAVWKSLPVEDQRVWDQLSDASKATILQRNAPGASKPNGFNREPRFSGNSSPAGPLGRPRPQPAHVSFAASDVLALLSAVQPVAEGSSVAFEANVNDATEHAETGDGIHHS